LPTIRENSLVLAKCLTPIIQSPETLLLIGEEGALALRGRIYVDLARSFARGSTWRQVEHRLGSIYSRQELLTKIQELVKRGLVRAPGTGTRAARAFWESIGASAVAGPVAVTNLCGSGAEPIIRALKGNGLLIRRKVSRVLAITDDYLRPELETIFEKWQECLLVKPIGHTIWIGPLLGTKASACWWCMAHWLRTNRWQQAAIYGWSDHNFPPQPSIAALPGTLALAAGMISTAMAIWLACGDYPELRNRIITLDARDLRMARHVVHRRPGCPHCCVAKSKPACAVPLRDWVSPLTGIVSEVEISEGQAFGFFQARTAQMQPLPRPGSRPLLQPSWVLGKGINAVEAETSCLGEAMERYSIIYQGNERARKATSLEIDGISPEAILLFSERQYEDRVSWNASHSPYHWVPERLDPRHAIHWTEVKNVLTGAKKYVPSGCCYLRYLSGNEPAYASTDSNGCASAQTLEEAILGGLLELIERDAVAIWWYNRLARPAADLRSFNEPVLVGAREKIAAEDRELYLLDVTNDLGVPVYVAVAPRRDGSELFFGSAAHPNSRTAAQKAIAELTQVLYWTSRLPVQPEVRRWLTTATLEDQEHFKPVGTVEAPKVQQCSKAVEEEIRECAERVQAAGVETYYLDLTRSETMVPVVRVLAPGLRHFWPRLGRGRLYEVPCRMGWLSKPEREEDLNPMAYMV
jgi:bacteriocin biosynthesis cyclodehydratase domain-containing protein